jgi:hypothetical protein
VSPPGTLPYPTSVGGTVPVCEEAGLGPFSVLPQDWASVLSSRTGLDQRPRPQRGIQNPGALTSRTPRQRRSLSGLAVET